MGFSNDTFSMNFDTLYDKYANRRVDLYRYKVKNYNSTLRKVLAHPSRNVLLLLENETAISAVLNTYQGVKTVVSISSGQNAGAAEGVNSETITLLTSDLLPVDYRNEMYVYALTKLTEKQLLSDDIYLDTLGASTLPELQELFYKGVKDEDKKVSNVLTLGKLKLKASPTNYKIYSYHDDNISYFDGNKNIFLNLPGILGEFGSSYLDENDHKRQMEYELQEDANHKYAAIQAVPTRLKPELVLSSDTYDDDKNLQFQIARNFIGGQTSLREIWTEYGFKVTNKDAAGNLYFAFLTIVYLANQRVTEFKDLRISEITSPNLGKINTTTLKNLYGVAVDDILNIEQKEFTGRILKTWEQENANILKDSTSKLNSLYQSVKAVLSGLTEYIPSPYSFGNFQKIGRLALEWYFVPDNMLITIDQVIAKEDFKLQLQSMKYEFNDSTKQISGLKESYRRISSVRTFNLDGQITLPSIPATFVEENKISTAGSVDISNNSFLNYSWIFQLIDASKYANLYQTKNPFIISGNYKNSYKTEYPPTPPFNDFFGIIINDGFDKLDPPSPGSYVKRIKDLDIVKAGTYTESTHPGIENYIQDHLMIRTRTIIANSAKVIVETKRFDQASSNNYYIVFKYTFTWTEKQITQITAEPIKPPYSIDQSQWETFESALGSNTSEFILKPLINEKINGTRKLSDIYWKSTLGNYATIKLTAIKKDGTSEEIELIFEQGFKRDQSLVQEGVYL